MGIVMGKFLEICIDEEEAMWEGRDIRILRKRYVRMRIGGSTESIFSHGVDRDLLTNTVRVDLLAVGALQLQFLLLEKYFDHITVVQHMFFPDLLLSPYIYRPYKPIT